MFGMGTGVAPPLESPGKPISGYRLSKSLGGLGATYTQIQRDVLPLVNSKVKPHGRLVLVS